jgi:acetolactate synthase-1/2/3 large subunit
VGARIADRAIPKPENLTRRAVIHIDIDTAEIGKNVGPTIPLVGDLREIFSLMTNANIERKADSWIHELEEIKKSTVDTRVFSDRLVDPNMLVQKLSEKLPEDATYVADVGQNQLWSADNYIMKEGRFMTTGGMGTMGYSIPAAIGAKLVYPERQTVAVIGDGAFQMAMNELATMRNNNVDLRILLVRNRYLGLVREYQHRNYDSHYEGVKLSDWPDYGKIAEAYGLEYCECESNDELDSRLDWFLGEGGARLMVCDVDSENNVK